ncbi:MAG: twin-arginine translocation signal domain-containing protein, partial [Stellaceae bacterium]
MRQSSLSRRDLLRASAIGAAILVGLGPVAAQPPRPRRKPIPPPRHVPIIVIDPG